MSKTSVLQLLANMDDDKTSLSGAAQEPPARVYVQRLGQDVYVAVEFSRQ